jgi:hypothetical protein
VFPQPTRRVTLAPPKSRAILNVRPWEATGAAVVSLTWDSNADLDLQMVTPSLVQVDAKHTASAARVDGGLPAGEGALERDSNIGCVPDGHRQENIVWATPPTPGQYLFKVDMFASCGEPVANFVLRVYVGGELKLTQAGRLLGSDADNGVVGDPAADKGTRAASSALAVANYTF